MHRRHIHTQILAQILHDTLRVLLGIDELLVLEPLELDGSRILAPQLQKREPVPFLRHGERDTRKRLGHIRQERHDYLLGTLTVLPLILLHLPVYAGDKRAQDSRSFLLYTQLDLQIHGLHDAAVMHPQEAAEGILPLHEYVEDIHIDTFTIYYQRFGIMLLQQLHLLLPQLRLLEVQHGRPLFHPLLKVLYERIGVALEYLHYRLDLRPVFLLAHLPDTRPGAFAQMIAQAYLVLAFGDTLGRDGGLAGPQPVESIDQSQQIVRVHGRAVRPEIPGTVLDEPTGNRHPGELLVPQAYPRIGLPVLEQDIVARLILLDKIVLQQECIRLRAYYSMVYVGYLRDHHTGLAVQPVGPEILRHPVLQVLGLAHVYHRPRSVQKTVDSGTVRQHFQFVQYVHLKICLSL